MRALGDNALFIECFLEQLIHVPVKDERGHVVNGFAAAQIPDWRLRQKLDDIRAALTTTPAPNAAHEALNRIARASVADGTYDVNVEKDLAAPEPHPDTRRLRELILHLRAAPRVDVAIDFRPVAESCVRWIDIARFIDAAIKEASRA